MNDQQPLVGAWRLISWENRAADGEVRSRVVRAYAGRYTLDGHQVIHHVELSLFPNWVGTQQQRFGQLSEKTLILSANPMLMAGRPQVPRLVWKRLSRPT
jgi:Lipocalin-like domain